MMLNVLIGALLEDSPFKPFEMAFHEDRVEYGKTTLPARFVPNPGFLPDNIAFTSPDGYVRVLRDGTIAVGEITLRFKGAERPEVIPEKQEGTFSLFSGKRSVPSLPVYRSVRLKNVYGGIDFVLNGITNGELEFYFYVRRGADPERIVVEISGGDVDVRPEAVTVRKGGKVALRIGSLRAFQGSEVRDVRFRLSGEGTFTFALNGYDPYHDLVIDPTVFLASPSNERATHVLPVGDGTVYVTGFTEDYLNFAGGYDYMHGTVVSGNKAVFVTRLSDDFSTHIATAIISGSGNDYGWQVAIADDSTVYVGASTSSSDYAPSRTVFGTTSTGFYDVAVTRLSADLSRHLSTAVVTGSDHDLFRAMAVGDDGTVYLTGYTYRSSDFAPTRTVHGSLGLLDAFVTRLSHDLSSHLNTAILTGSSNDAAYSVTVLSDGVYVSGETNSTDFAPSRNVFGTPGGWDAYVTKLSFDLSTHITTAIIAGSGLEVVYRVFRLPSGDFLVFGRTTDPSTLAPSRTVWGTPGERDAYVSRLSSDLSSHIATVVIASPDTDIVVYRTYDVRGDTAFLGISTVDPANLAGSVCTVCDVASGGGPMDVVVVALSTDLSSCIGKSIITGVGDDGIYTLDVEGSDIYVAGVSIIGDTSDLATYPGPHYFYGYRWGEEGFLVKARPRCIVSVDEMPSEKKETDVTVAGRSLIFHLTHPSYIGYDLYSPDGRLMARRSLGYFLKGRHEFRLEDVPTGTYVLKVRVGDRIRSVKVVIRE